MKAAMLKDKLRGLPEINVERGLRYSVDNLKNYRKSLYMVHKSIKFKLPLILSMIEEEEYEGLGVIVHTLSQLLEHIGAEKLVRECSQIESKVLNAEPETLQESVQKYAELLADFMIRLEASLPAVDALAAKEQGMDLAGASLKREELIRELHPNQKIV